ncbi:MAG: DUF3095 family protein [Ignavibacteriales bacterium]|nr:DUF3095 family protein [Ignavibacteriales bacterium]
MITDIANSTIAISEGLKTAGFCLIEDIIEDIPDLSGFECRWNSVKSNKGFTLALLIKARLRGDRETEIYEKGCQTKCRLH